MKLFPIHFNMLTALCLMLTGCVTQQQFSVQGTQATQAGAVGSIPSSQGRVLASSGPILRHLYTTAGTTVKVASTFSVKPDCTFNGYNEIRVTEKPAHGKAVVSHIKDGPNFPASNPHAACNGLKLPGTLLKYTPEDDFTGVDLLKAEIVMSDGQDIEVKVSITVK